ncbi:Sacchrp-dh-NADP domain-containing protein [Aphelenchoides besseyi]|nr:Sacchrp-dh-NADP domain-containing protein [Aphelenchoides besseyi]
MLRSCDQLWIKSKSSLSNSSIVLFHYLEIHRDLSAIEILTAENSDSAALNEMAKQTHVLINSAGPFWKFGEEVIRAAVANGTSHLDISGEAVWAERIQATYNKEAKANGAIVISSCAFDSIPADFGVQFLRQNFDGLVAYVRSHSLHRIEFISGQVFCQIRYSETTVLGVIQRKEHPPVWFNRDLNAYAIPYPGDRLPGTDQSVVDRTQYHEFAVNGRRPARFIYYVQGYGWAANENVEIVEPKKKLTIKCEGPDAGYVGTARLILAAALTLIEEREQIPVAVELLACGRNASFSWTADVHRCGLWKQSVYSNDQETWFKSHSNGRRKLSLKPKSTRQQASLKLTLKDLCVLEFEGKRNEYAKWTNKHGNVTNCFSTSNCRFEVKNGKLFTLHEHKDIGCFNVRNQLDSEWSWTKLRLENLSANCVFEISTKNNYDELFEYDLPTKKSVLPKTTAKPPALSKFSVKTVGSFGLVFAVIFIGL